MLKDLFSKGWQVRAISSVIISAVVIWLNQYGVQHNWWNLVMLVGQGAAIFLVADKLKKPQTP
jgi:hypothetical protein